MSPDAPVGPWGFSDSAKRAADQVNLHIDTLKFAAVGRWVALRLSDGGSDGVLYDSKRDAIIHQLHEKLCAYLCIPPMAPAHPVTPREMEAYLTLHRSMYDAGFRLQDPDDPRTIINPLISVAAPRYPGRRPSRLALPYRGEWR